MQELQAMQQKVDRQIKERDALRAKLIKDEKIMVLLKMVETEAFFRLQRRFIISRLLHAMQSHFKELAKRIGIAEENVFALKPEETIDFLQSEKKPDKKILEQRGKLWVLHGDDEKIDVFTGEKAEEFLIKIGKGQQTKLVNIATKKEIRYREELMQIKQSLDRLMKEAPQKQKQLAYAYWK